MKMLSRKEIEFIKTEYPHGTRIELLKMDDPQAPPKHTQGTVFRVDDFGNIMMHWDTGSTLSLIYGLDKFVKLRC